MRLIIQRDGKTVYEDPYVSEPAAEAHAVVARFGPGTYIWRAEKVIYEFEGDELGVIKVLLVDFGVIEQPSKGGSAPTNQPIQ